MPLSLTARKAIRDTTEDLNANLARINAATGKTFTFDIDWEYIAAEVADLDPERFGDVYHKEVLGNVAYCFEEAVKDPLIKQALIDATSNNKIKIKVNDNASSYWVYTFPNGEVVLEQRKSLCNTGDLSYVDLTNFLPVKEGSLPLPVQKNIASNKEVKEQYLNEIAETTGAGPWTVVADFNTIISKIEDGKERIGDIYFNEVLQNFAYLLKNKFSNELIKEAFNEATPKKTITYEVSADIEGYWSISIKDGGVLLSHKPYISNTGDISYYNIEKIIPVSGLIDLVAKLDLNEYKSKRDDAIETISSAAGVPITFDESSIDAFYKAADEGERQRLGNIIYGEVLPYLADNLNSALKDDLLKEGFLEAVTAKKIAVATNQSQDGYWNLKIADGVLVLSAKMPVCNTGDISSIKLESIL